MLILVNTLVTFELTGADTGQVGIITFEIYDPATGDTIVAPTTQGITEPREGTYVISTSVPQIGSFFARWVYPDPADPSQDVVAEEEVDVATTDVPDIRGNAIDTPIGTEAHDLLPETWDALAAAASFGQNALMRRHDRVVNRIFGTLLSVEQQEVLPSRIIEYAGLTLALALCDPGIDYWSKQVLSRSVGERESSAYKDRAEDLRLYKKEWTAALADMWVDIQSLIPPFPGRAGDAPRVVQAGSVPITADNPRTGTQVIHVTPSVDDLEPAYGPPEATT
jgi:hypothetical protein